MSGLIDKAKGLLGHESKKHDTTTPSTNSGPHNSNLINKLDPTVYSDHRNDPTSRVGGYGTQKAFGNTTGHAGAGGLTGTSGHAGMGGHTGTGGHTGLTGGHTGTGGLTGHPTGYAGTTTSTNAGPHDSNVANKLDPRVDSDKDGSMKIGGNPTNV